MKKAAHIVFVLLSAIGFSTFAIFRLNEYLTLETIQLQLDAGFQIIYVDPTFMIDIASLITMPCLFLYVVWNHILGKKESKWIAKGFFSILAISMIIIIPGQIFEHQRQKSLARTQGFVDCPPFTLLSSTHIVEAMVKDPQYCTDDEITTIAKYGYFRELPIVNAYVKETYQGSKQSSVN
ncbi:conserved membrane hypothetical protein [Vibrio nigripulchritudo SOn1]|uniref:DUF2079 domain-containing protein n=1 Tax=Vibrio nigripulchritudo SOn1 TaxID=1238450 RepID=A0AAV2VQR4_9VIBR|nr:hypothetical protein [Vibrio nigripulchritudo]CCO47011.1 conserved membrane hypothetical protein [Vibrio nigripulchritudo SOn1]